MRLIPRGRGRHAAGIATVRPAASPPTRFAPRELHPRTKALNDLQVAAERLALHVERGALAVRLSMRGVQPVTVRVDYQRGAWCYVWTTHHGPRDSIGPVSDVDAVARLIAHALHTRGTL